MTARAPGRLRVAVAGCRFFTTRAVTAARAYAGLTDVVELPCETTSEEPEAHLDEPDTVLTPAVVEALRREEPDAVVVPPGHRGVEADLPRARIVPVALDPVCLLDRPAAPGGAAAFLARPAAVSALLVAAILDRPDLYVYLPFVSAEHLRSQTGVARRAGIGSAVADPAAVPLVAGLRLAARSYLDPPTDCVVVHAVERALARAVLATLRRQAHLESAEAREPWLTARPHAGSAAAPGALDVVALRSGRRFVLVPQSSIAYVTSLTGVVTAHADAGRFWTNQTLAELERRLDPRRFLRIDQSHIVNVERLAELVPWTHQRYRLVLADAAKSELVLSRDVGRRLRAALGW